MHHWTLITFITIHRRLGLNTVALWITSLWSCATLQARQAKRESTVFIYSQGQAWRSFKYRRSGMHLFTQRITVAEPQTTQYPFVFVCLLCRRSPFILCVCPAGRNVRSVAVCDEHIIDWILLLKVYCGHNAKGLWTKIRFKSVLNSTTVLQKCLVSEMPSSALSSIVDFVPERPVIPAAPCWCGQAGCCCPLCDAQWDGSV